MYKIFLSVRNRLSITKHCIAGIKKHSKVEYKLYVFDNLTNYKTKEHFEYFGSLYENNLISQVTFNTYDSTFGAFSKATSCNQFGLNHIIDPYRDDYEFLLFLDNDMIVTPGFDEILSNAWKDVHKKGLKNIKIITQMPGGMVDKRIFEHQLGEKDCIIGKYGGSGFWSVKPNFFDDVGFLKLKKLVGLNKKHDQEYWKLLSKFGNEYIVGLNAKMSMHMGCLAGSICNSLSRMGNTKQALDKIKFEQQEEELDKLSFDDFYNSISNKEDLYRW